MSFTSASNGRAPSQQPSHPLSSVDLQWPAWMLNHQDTPFPNFRDAHLDDSRRSVVLPNLESFIASHSQVPGDLDENLDLSSSHLPFTTADSSQSQNFCVSNQTQYYVPAGPLPYASFVTDTTALRQPTYPPSGTVTGITHPTMPSTGPSGFGSDQPTWNNHTTQYGLVAAAHEPALGPTPSTPLPRQPFDLDPRVFHSLPTASAVQAQPMNLPYEEVTGWRQPEEGRASVHVSPRPRGPRTRPLRTPLVRVEDQVEWVRPHVLKVTLWLNWSPNAEAEAHEPWD